MIDADLLREARSYAPLALSTKWPRISTVLTRLATALEERGAQLERAREAPNGFIAQLKEAIQRENAWRHRALAAEQALERAKEECDSWRDLAEQRATNWATAEDERDRAQTELDLVARAIPGVRYMDPPDGGSVTVAEQVARMCTEMLTATALAQEYARQALAAENQRAEALKQNVKLSTALAAAEQERDRLRLSRLASIGLWR